MVQKLFCISVACFVPVLENQLVQKSRFEIPCRFSLFLDPTSYNLLNILVAENPFMYLINILFSIFKPPPPGHLPNAAQMAAMQGANVVMTQRKGNYFMGGSSGGYTIW